MIEVAHSYLNHHILGYTMNFFKTTISLLVCCTLANGAFASQNNNDHYNDGQNIHQPIVGEQKLKMARAHKARQDSLYYIQLEDQSLSTYDGHLTGFSATSIKSTQGKNTQSTGLLSTTSSNSKTYISYIKEKQSQFKLQAQKAIKRDLTIKHDYQLIINALAAEMSEQEAELLATLSGVKSVSKVGMHYIQTDSGPEFIHAKKVWDGVDSHAATKGEGVIIGIIDTGINAYHPSFADIGGDGYDHENPLGKNNYLGDCIAYAKFCNDKLIGIVSYPEIIDSRGPVLNNDYEEIEDKLKVGYDFNAHGSHVASTAAGNILTDVPYYLSITDNEGSIVDKSAFSFDQVSGVAPHANIVSYQVCTGEGCYPELTIKSLEHAIENGVNVMNYSVGGSANNPWRSTDSLAFLNARAAGLHIATSAGNSGPDAHTIGAPGNAPWITSVAAYTHDRDFSEKAIKNFSGGESTPSEISGLSATGGITGKIVLASDFGDENCNSPFDENTFSGEIVVCNRGTIARVRKGVNVLAGGAGGLILANVEDGNESINADSHLLPAIHINAEDGQTLKTWLTSGTEHQVTITPSVQIKNSELGDVAGVFTSRGPNLPFGTVFAPDVAAPGVDIYAANSEDHPWNDNIVETPYTSMSGTSMSSPHVAGALALIYAVHNDWTPAQAQSALMTTAKHVTYKDDDFDGVKDRSDFFDQGAGSIRVDAAIKAGLLLNITKQEYLDADPDQGGDPAKLNSSSMVSEACLNTCSWTRTVTAAAAGSWTASYEYMQPGVEVTVSPANFTLAKGQSKELTISISANINLVDEWTHSFVQLTPSDSQLSVTRLQVLTSFIAGTVAEFVEAEVNNVNKTVVINDVNTTGSNDLQVRGFGLFKAKKSSGSAVGAGTDKRPYMNLASVYAIQIMVPPYTKRLIADIVSSSAPDMDLYVGIDEDLNGLPNASEVFYSTLCISGNAGSVEHCDIETPPTGTYWIFAHNYEGTNEGEMDDVTISVSLIKYSEQPSFDIDVPESVAQNETFDINLSINGSLSETGFKSMESGEKYYGVVEIGTTPDLKHNVGKTLLSITALENTVAFTGRDTTAIVGDELNYTIEIPKNNGEDKSHALAVTFPEGFTIVTASQDYTETGNSVNFITSQAANSGAVNVDFVVATSGVTAGGNYHLTAQHSVNDSEAITITSYITEIEVAVVALINDNPSSVIEVNEGSATIALSAIGSTGNSENDSLTYLWEQTAGTTLALSATDTANVNFATPANIVSTETYTYQVTVTNGSTSDTATISIKVANVVKAAPIDNKKSSSGGSTSVYFLMMVGLTVFTRRKK